MKRSSIHCPVNSLCSVHCTDYESCSLSDIHCDEGSQCFLDCTGDLACVDLEIYAQNASNLQVYCQDSGCDDLSMYCPLNTNASENGICSLDFRGNGSTGISVYALNGLSDVHISNANDSQLQQLQDVNVFCGDEYTSQCKVSSLAINECMDANSLCALPLMNTTTIAPRRPVLTKGNIFDIVRPTKGVLADVDVDELDVSFMNYIRWICQDRLLFVWIGMVLMAIIVCFGGWNLLKARRIGKKRERLQAHVDSDSDEFRMSGSEGDHIFV